MTYPRIVSKLPFILRTLARNPAEFYDRLENRVDAFLEMRKHRAPSNSCPPDAVTPSEALDHLEKALSMQIGQFLQDSGLCDIEKKLCDSMGSLRLNAPFALGYNADISMARLCYLICRALVPEIVLETGVAYGVTTAFLVQATALNGKGRVYSIDLPPLGSGSGDYVGFFVPRELRSFWSFHRGSSRRMLPKLLSSLNYVDVFVQDSSHTYHGITSELEVVWPFLKPGGVLIADDVGLNRAFQDFVKNAKPSFSIVAQEEHKDSMFGVLIKGT